MALFNAALPHFLASQAQHEAIYNKASGSFINIITTSNFTSERQVLVGYMLPILVTVANFEMDKASALCDSVRYVVVDGHHRFQALMRLKEQNDSGFELPDRVSIKNNLNTKTCMGTVNIYHFSLVLLLEIACCIMEDLTVLEQFVFSERANFTNHEGEQ